MWDKIKEEQYKIVSNADESNWLNLVYSAENIDESVVWKCVVYETILSFALILHLHVKEYTF